MLGTCKLLSMFVLFIYLICVFVTLGVCMLASLSDVRSFTIPNSYSLYMIGLFFVTYGALEFFAPEMRDVIFGSFLSHLYAFLVFFVVTFIFFSLNFLGAGDSKFGAACAFWFGLKYLPIYLFFMTFFGGVLGIVTLYLRHKKPFKSPSAGGWLARAQEGASQVPYGVAIALGVAVTFVYAGYLSPSVLATF